MTRSTLAAVVALLALTGAAPCVAQSASPRAAVTAPDGIATGDLALRDAWRREARDVPIEIRAVVVKLLKDDRAGLRHQRFLVRAAGLSLLVAHNIDLAPRAPVQVGDTVRLRGEYVWNDKGGVLHWTHHDPRGRHAPGFIEVRGQRVQ